MSRDLARSGSKQAAAVSQVPRVCNFHDDCVADRGTSHAPTVLRRMSRRIRRYTFTTFTNRDAAVSSMRRLVKSNRLRSASCEG